MERVVHLKSFEFLIRPIKPEDSSELQKALLKMSSNSIDQRFFAMKRSFSENELNFLTKVDDENHLAYVAIFNNKATNKLEGAGVIRAIRNVHDSNSAEIAITIIDQFQGLGLGRELCAFLSERALSKNISVFTGSLKRTNTPMMRLLLKFQNFETTNNSSVQTGNSIINFKVTLPFKN